MKVYLVKRFDEDIGDYGDTLYGSISKEKAQAKANEYATIEIKKSFEGIKKRNEKGLINFECAISILEYMLYKKSLPSELSFKRKTDKNNNVIIDWKYNGEKQDEFYLFGTGKKSDMEREIKYLKKRICEYREEIENLDFEKATEGFVKNYLIITEMEIEE